MVEQVRLVSPIISRTTKWATRNPETARAALYRALDLFDLILDDPRHRQSVARLREIARVREVVVDLFHGPNQFGSTPEALQRYFDAYAVCRSRR